MSTLSTPVALEDLAQIVRNYGEVQSPVWEAQNAFIAEAVAKAHNERKPIGLRPWWLVRIGAQARQALSREMDSRSIAADVHAVRGELRRAQQDIHYVEFFENRWRTQQAETRQYTEEAERRANAPEGTGASEPPDAEDLENPDEIEQDERLQAMATRASRSHPREATAQEREQIRLIHDPHARFPDEEHEAPENDPDGPACKFQEYLEDHMEALGSQHYVQLCNISASFAKLERRAGRMRKKLLDYDGSDCSALMPSDDEHIDEGDDGSLDEDEYDSDGSVVSTDAVPCSDASTTTSAAGDEIPSKEISANVAALNPSGYFIKYMCTYYAVPKPNILRNYKRPIMVPTVEALRGRIRRGSRAKCWKWEPINPASIVVVKMQPRGSTDEPDLYWCVSLELDEGTAPTEDSKILHVLPGTTVIRLLRTIEADESMKDSSLITKYMPRWATGGPIYTIAPPVLGPSRKRCVSQGIQGTSRYVHTAGNYWPRLKASKRLRSSADFTAAELEDSDDEEPAARSGPSTSRARLS